MTDVPTPSPEIAEAAPDAASRRRLGLNSALLALAVAANAGTGGVFWLIAARRFTPEDVGIAGATISALTLIANVSQCGFHAATVRFSRRDSRTDAVATLALAVIVVSSLVLGLGYVRGYPFFTDDPRIETLLTGASGVMIVVGATVYALNLYTDFFFIARRRPVFNVVCNGVVQGVARIVLILSVAVAGAGAIVGAALAATTAALGASVIAMIGRCRFRPVRPRRRVLAAPARFALTAVPIGVLDLIPPTILPVIVLSQQGAAAAGAFYVAFQVAALANGAVFAINESLFAEGARIRGSLAHVALRALALVAAVGLVATAVVWVAGRGILTLFGSHYADSGHALLLVLVAGCLAVGMNSWISTLVRLRGRQSVLIAANVAYTVTVIAGAALAPRYGMVTYGWAWAAGHLACAAVACLGLPAFNGRARALVRRGGPAGA